MAILRIKPLIDVIAGQDPYGPVRVRRYLDLDVVKYWELGASHETEQFSRCKFDGRTKNRSVVGEPNLADQRLIRIGAEPAGLDQFRHWKRLPAYRRSGKLRLPLVLSEAGLRLFTARRHNRHIRHRADGENFIDELLQPMDIAGDDAESTYAGQVLGEQCPTLHQAVGSRSHLLLNKQPT